MLLFINSNTIHNIILQNTNNQLRLNILYFLQLQLNKINTITNKSLKMRRVRKPITSLLSKSNNQIIKPYSVIAFFSDEDIQFLNSPCDKVKFAMNRNKINKKIKRMKLTAREMMTSVLNASQVGFNQKIMLIKNIGQIDDYNQFKWVDEKKTDHDYIEYINPSIVSAKDPSIMMEQSISAPLIQTKVWRYNEIQVKYTDINEKQHQVALKGLQARVFQHGYDYFFGRNFLDWRMHHGDICIQQQSRDKLPKTNEVIKQYSKQLKNTLQQFPHLKKYPTQLKETIFKEKKQQQDSQQQQISKSKKKINRRFLKTEGFLKNEDFFQNLGQSQVMSIQQDFMQRIVKHYRKQMVILLERLEIEQRRKNI